MIKYAGLFCDAGWVNYSNETSSINELVTPGLEFKNGICWAKKAITPVTKTNEISIDFNWILYIPRNL